MEITIELVLEQACPAIVRFGSLVGGAEAVWYGQPPTIGESFLVEIEIEDFDLPPDNLQRVELSGSRAPSIGRDANGMIRIVGESTSDHGELVRLRVGDGFIALPAQIKPEPGVWLELSLKQIALFDTNM